MWGEGRQGLVVFFFIYLAVNPHQEAVSAGSFGGGGHGCGRGRAGVSLGLLLVLGLCAGRFWLGAWKVYTAEFGNGSAGYILKGKEPEKRVGGPKMSNGSKARRGVQASV